MLKKGNTKKEKKGQYLHKDSSFNIRDLVTRTPTSSSPQRSPELYCAEKQTKSIKHDAMLKPSPIEILKSWNEKLNDIIQELNAFDVRTIQRRSDPRMKMFAGRINDIVAEIIDRNSDEYDDYAVYSLDTLPITIGGSWHPLPEVQEGYRKGIQLALSKLASLRAIQKKKLDELTAEKPRHHVVHEQPLNQRITGKEKVSLVNLRGKIKSRESVFFSQVEPVKGSSQTSHPHNGESTFSDKTTEKALHNNFLKPPQTDDKEIQNHTIDQESIKEVLYDHKKPLLLENLEEKLITLEKTQPIPDEREQNVLLKESGYDEDSLPSLVAKLNEIVTKEPEYADVHKNTLLNIDENILPISTNEDSSCVMIGEESIERSFIEIEGLELAKLEENGEVLVIDGDNVLSSDSNFIETLEEEDRQWATIKPIEKNEPTEHIAGEKKRILLEDLERKLKEFDGEEVVERRLHKDCEKEESEEIIIIGSSNNVPEEIKNEFVPEAYSEQTFEARLGNEEVLVINGDTNLDKELQKITLQDTLQDYAIKEEMLIIDCDSEFPEDLIEQLQQEQVICAHVEAPSNELETSKARIERFEESEEASDTNRSLIIDLYSHATLLKGSDEHITKEVLIEDIEERLTDFNPVELDQEFLSYTAEESGAHTEGNNAEESFSESKKAELRFGEIEDVCNNLESCSAADTLSVIHDQGILISHTLIGDEIHVPSEFSVSDENNTQEFKSKSLPIDWEDLYCRQELGENDDLRINVNYEVLYENARIENVYNVFSDRILLIKEIEGLSDHIPETLNTAMVHVECLEQIVEKTNLDENSELASVELCDSIPDGLLESECGSSGMLMIGHGELTQEEAVFVVEENDFVRQMPKELQIFSEKICVESPEGIIDVCEHNRDEEELLSEDTCLEMADEKNVWHIEESVLTEINKIQETVLSRLDIGEEIAEAIPKEIIDCEMNTSWSAENLATDSFMMKNCDEITKNAVMGELSSTERSEFEPLEMDEIFNQVGLYSLQYDTAFEMVERGESNNLLENAPNIDEQIQYEAFEKSLTEPEWDSRIESTVEECRNKDDILLEALEEMLCNLEANIPEQNQIHSETIITQNTHSRKDQNVHVVESHMEIPQKAVLIKSAEECSNPFAMAGAGREKPHSKQLGADDLQEQIAELRYRIDDLKTFDIESINQRFDPRVRALGDTVNNTLADIFGRNTPLYWQHALPSLDSLPVVVGGPKLSPEELRDAYRKRINDAISKVSMTIGLLETKLGKLEDKSSGGQVLFFSPKAEKYHGIQSMH